LEIFDSLGVDSNKLDILKNNLIIKNIKTLIFNETKFQHDNSVLCGKFVLLYIFDRLYNLDMPLDDFLESIFYDDPILNDSVVETFCQNLM
jgi:hypothetical protein